MSGWVVETRERACPCRATRTAPLTTVYALARDAKRDCPRCGGTGWVTERYRWKPVGR